MRSLLLFAAFAVLSGLNPLPGQAAPMERARNSAQMQTARMLVLAMFQFANDHDGKYPQGKSSTEIFQQLLDQKYVSDSSVFYFPMVGKTAPTSGQLKPENVCWDVTNGVQLDDPDSLPVIFATGYKIDYASGGVAHPLAGADPAGIAVAYKGNTAMYVRAQAGVISILTTAFDPKGKTYTQLTP